MPGQPDHSYNQLRSDSQKMHWVGVEMETIAKEWI